MRLLSVDARVTGRDRAALSALIESAGADVACVHHGPHLLRWRSITAAVGRRAGLVVVGGGRPAAGNLLLSSLGVDALGAQDADLAAPGRRTAGAALAVLRHGGARFGLVSATLVGNAGERLAQAHRLQGAVAGLAPDSPPPVICVTGADRPGTGAWQTLAEGRTPVAGRIFVGAGLTVGETHELPGYADAPVPPVVVELATG